MSLKKKRGGGGKVAEYLCNFSIPFLARIQSIFLGPVPGCTEVIHILKTGLLSFPVSAFS